MMVYNMATTDALINAGGTIATSVLALYRAVHSTFWEASMAIDSNQLLGQSLGTCTLQRLLGQGGMGAVYLAQQTRPRRTVAVKVLLPDLLPKSVGYIEFLVRFRREADSIAALDHVNIM